MAQQSDLPTASGTPRVEGNVLSALGQVRGRLSAGASGSRRWFVALYRRSKPLALIVLFVTTACLMWGTTTLYRTIAQQLSHAKKEAGPAGPTGPVPVNVLQLKPTTFQDTINAVGTILGGTEIPLRFEVEGRIESFPLHEGDKVRRGQLIAQLRQRDASLKLKRAITELKDAETLYTLGAIKKSQLEQTRLFVEMAQSELEKTTLRAPRDGVLGNKSAEVGQFVTPTQKIANLVSIETVIVQIGIIEKEIDKVFPGQRVSVTVDTYPNQEFTGKVDAISPIVEGRAKTLTVQARLANEGGLLLPGMFARTKIIVFEQEEALMVPQESLMKTSQGGFQVFVVRGEPEKHSAEGPKAGSERKAKGLSAGELVVVERPHGLKDGDPVKVLEVQK
ncbi:MAG: efflux RND transporter periplasmic adaptor subunit [Elusimicrobia bacterium]|nr:efflux RND transporter periplasmic adaptor subunit [Elusimicrobiota bacterium]